MPWWYKGKASREVLEVFYFQDFCKDSWQELRKNRDREEYLNLKLFNKAIFLILFPCYDPHSR